MRSPQDWTQFYLQRVASSEPLLIAELVQMVQEDVLEAVEKAIHPIPDQIPSKSPEGLHHGGNV